MNKGSKMKSGIYVIEIGGMYYVGSTKNFEKRFINHLKGLNSGRHHNLILQRTFDKYKPQRIEMKILETVPYERNLIITLEQFYIDSYRKEFKGRCCNISDASFGDILTNNPNRELILEKRSNTTRQNMKMMSPEERKQKFGKPGSKNGMYGKTHTDDVKRMLREREYSNETRDKMSKSAINKFEKNPLLKENISLHASQRTGDKNPFYGKSHTEETKALIREKVSGDNSWIKNIDPSKLPYTKKYIIEFPNGTSKEVYGLKCIAEEFKTSIANLHATINRIKQGKIPTRGIFKGMNIYEK